MQWTTGAFSARTNLLLPRHLKTFSLLFAPWIALCRQFRSAKLASTEFLSVVWIGLRFTDASPLFTAPSCWFSLASLRSAVYGCGVHSCTQSFERCSLKAWSTRSAETECHLIVLSAFSRFALLATALALTSGASTLNCPRLSIWHRLIV